MTPGVQAVRVTEESPTRQIIQIDIHVLWKRLTLVFEVERNPPHASRFRLHNPAIGDYLGVCRFVPVEGGTRVELATWLKPAMRIPSGLVLWVERATFLPGIRRFLDACGQGAPTA